VSEQKTSLITCEHGGWKMYDKSFDRVICQRCGQNINYELKQESYPDPVAILTTQISTSLAKEKEAYIVKAFQEIGINPLVIAEQQALIATLKSDILSLREQIAQEIEVDCKRREHAKGSVTSVGANGSEVSFFEPVVCKSCANAAAIARGQDEPR